MRWFELSHKFDMNAESYPYRVLGSFTKLRVICFLSNTFSTEKKIMGHFKWMT